jgi:CRP/FNR family cyclic AMP-dependent transcriptional regulator
METTETTEATEAVVPNDTDLLGGVPIFHGLSPQFRADLAATLEVVRVPAGQKLFSYGDPGDSMYIVRAGEAEVFFRNDTGERVVLETPGPGAFFGEISLLDGGPRTASVEATRDLELLKLDRQHLAQFLQSHPAAALSLLGVMGGRLRVTDDRLRHTATRNVNDEEDDTRTVVMKVADWIAEFSGSIPFLGLHVLWFFIWIGWNQVAEKFHARPFDPFPYGLLTMAVSLEAIFLSVFVLLSQNRQVAKDRIRSDIEYDVNLKAELEIAHLHEKFDHLRSELLGRLDHLDGANGRR